MKVFISDTEKHYGLASLWIWNLMLEFKLRTSPLATCSLPHDILFFVLRVIEYNGDLNV